MATTEEIDFVRHQERKQAHGRRSGEGGADGRALLRTSMAFPTSSAVAVQGWSEWGMSGQDDSLTGTREGKPRLWHLDPQAVFPFSKWNFLKNVNLEKKYTEKLQGGQTLRA